MPDRATLTDLCEKRLWEQAVSQVLLRISGSSRFARLRQAAAARREAFVIALDEEFDWKMCIALLQAGDYWADIANRLPVHEMLRPEVAWALMLTVSGPENVFAHELERYLRRHTDVPRRLPRKVIARTTPGVYRVTIEFAELADGEPDLQII